MTSRNRKLLQVVIRKLVENQSNAGNGGQTTDSPERQCEQSKACIRGVQSTECCVTCNSKVSGRRMITTQQNLQNHLNDGSITQEEYNEYYPYDGMEGSYYSVFVETDLNKATGAGR